MGKPAAFLRGLSALVPALFSAGLGAAPAPRFTRLSVEQGLSQSTVQVILQDHVGFLWLGTEEGLNRYDGYAFVAFKHDPQDARSLPDNMVSALHEDRQHRLWVGALSVVPLLFGDRLIGMLTLDKREPGFYMADHARLALAFAAQAAIAMENARLYTSAQRELEERKRAELAVRQAEEKYRGIFENAVEGIFQTTLDGRFLTVNPALARMLGYGSPEEMQAEVTDIERQLYVDPARRQEVQHLLEERGVVHGFECEMRCRNGSTLWVSASVRIVRDDAGKVLRYEGTCEDISDRRRAQQAEAALRTVLEKAAVEWQGVFDSMEASILVVDAEGRIARLNRAARDLAMSAGVKDPAGRALADVGGAPLWQKAGEVAALVAKTRSVTRCQVRDRASGRTWDVTAAPSAADERVIVVARDVARSGAGARA